MSNRYIQIAKYKYKELSNEEIATSLDVSIHTINNDIKSPEYKIVKEKYFLDRSELKNKESGIRSRLLVEKMLSVLEDKIEFSENPLQYLDDVKKLSDITGLAVDSNKDLNVIAINDLSTIEEFNSKVDAEKEDSIPEMDTRIDVSSVGEGNLPTQDHPKTPEDLTQPSSVYTPTQTQKSNIELLTEETELEKDIWEDA